MSQGDRQGALAKEEEGVKLPRHQQGQQPSKQGVTSATPKGSPQQLSTDSLPVVVLSTAPSKGRCEVP